MKENVKEEKKKIKEYIWNLLEEKKVATFPLPCKGRIPNFKGSDKAAEKLRELRIWKNAKTVFVGPDSPQKKVREFALKDGKTLIVATPRLKKGFMVIYPEKVRGMEMYASTIKGCFKFGKRMDSPIKPDIIVIGSVAVDRKGNRLGKGGGYGDREIDFFEKEFGKICVATTVHDLQIVRSVPSEKHDKKIDVIVTPNKVIKVGGEDD